MLVILRERLFEPQAFFLYLYLEPGNVILGILFRRFEERHDIPAADGNVIALVPFKATGIRWHDLLVIFGHTPTFRFDYDLPVHIWHGENRIGIDCGCGHGTGCQLGCLRLDDMKEFYTEVVL